MTAPHSPKGTVYLVGAGPGDPDLLTRKAYKLLQKADLVAHDALISQEILSLISEEKLVMVGHRSSQKRPPLIDQSLFEAVDKGQNVVRLKSGDPFLFARVGEEIAELKARSIPYEIIPGISSFMGAASSMKIPLTHREIAQELHCFSGHRAKNKIGHAKNVTTIGFMVRKRLEENVAQLIARGYRPSTPSALMINATRPEEKVLVAPLSHLKQQTVDQGFFRPYKDDAFPPCLLIVGDVLRESEEYASSLSAFQHKKDTPDTPKEKKGMLLVYTGDGKGKTTAALGIVMRHIGYGKPIGMVQFIKGKRQTGENFFASQTPLFHNVISGKGFTWNSNDLNQDRQAAQKGWEQAQQMIQSDRYETIILDEITYPINYGFLSVDKILETLKKRPKHIHIILTGRKAPQELIVAADLVTTMEPTKHPYKKGIKAIKSLDF